MTTSRRGGLRDVLLATAARMMEEGEVELSLRSIARAAGVSAMAPYRHFSDKESLLTAVADNGFAMLHDRLARADRAAVGREALVEQGMAYVAFAAANPALFRLMFGRSRECEMPASGAAYGVLANRVAALAPEERRGAAILACWATVHGLATLSIDGRFQGPGNDDDANRAALNLLIDGLVVR
jgi:AcrR family transcriptional regulator